jgi:hypothetical protein
MPIGTRHDDTKVLMGASLSTASECSVESLPGTIAAGLAFRKNTTTGAYQASASGAGPILGISMGRSLGNNGQFSGCYAAPKIVVQLGSGHTPVVGAQVNIDDSNGKTKASGGGATAINAVYEKLITGISELDGTTEIDCVIINMIGGA